LFIHKISKSSLSFFKLRVFSFCVAIIHAAGELVVVSALYFRGDISPAHVEQGFFVSVLLLVGLGTVIHSMVDFEIAQIILLPLKNKRTLLDFLRKCKYICRARKRQQCCLIFNKPSSPIRREPRVLRWPFFRHATWQCLEIK